MQCHSSQKNPTTHQQKTCWYWSFPFFIKKVCTWPAVSIAGNSIFEQKLKTQLWFATLLLDLGSFDGLCIYCFKYDYTCWHFSCSKTNTIMQTHSAIVDSLGEPTDSFGCHKLQCLCANICLQCLRLLSALSYRYCVCVTWINTNKHLHHKMCFWKLQETHPTCLYPPTATCLCSLSNQPLPPLQAVWRPQKAGRALHIIFLLMPLLATRVAILLCVTAKPDASSAPHMQTRSFPANHSENMFTSLQWLCPPE